MSLQSLSIGASPGLGVHHLDLERRAAEKVAAPEPQETWHGASASQELSHLQWVSSVAWPCPLQGPARLLRHWSFLSWRYIGLSGLQTARRASVAQSPDDTWRFGNRSSDLHICISLCISFARMPSLSKLLFGLSLSLLLQRAGAPCALSLEKQGPLLHEEGPGPPPGWGGTVLRVASDLLSSRSSWTPCQWQGVSHACLGGLAWVPYEAKSLLAT